MKAGKWGWLCLVVLLIVACGGQGIETRPGSEVVTPEVPRLGVSPYPAMFQVLTVVQKFGKLTGRHMSYDQYRKSGSNNDSAFNPGFFYDRYELDLNEQNHWVTLTFNTAERAIAKDPRIESLMKDFPSRSMDMKMKIPAGTTYLMSDSNADGVLEYASMEGSENKNSARVDIQLLKRMQKKYRWILGIVKRYYRL